MIHQPKVKLQEIIKVRLDIAENWKYYSKIIFKCVNSDVEPIFNESFAEKRGF